MEATYPVTSSHTTYIPYHFICMAHENTDIPCKRHKEDYLRWKQNQKFSKCTPIPSSHTYTNGTKKKYGTTKLCISPTRSSSFACVHSPMSGIQLRGSKIEKYVNLLKSLAMLFLFRLPVHWDTRNEMYTSDFKETNHKQMWYNLYACCYSMWGWI